MRSNKNLKQRALIVTLFTFLILGCKFGSSTADNVVVDKVRPANASPAVPNSAVNYAEVQPTPSRTQSANGVCPDPEEPCHHADKRFDEWELPFKMPAKLKPNTPYRSGQFYAVILKTYPMADDCDGGEFITAAEEDRKREQTNQLERKVFASYECPNMGAVNYDFNGRFDAKKEKVLIGNFIAIYVGTTKIEADEALSSLKKNYPKAQLKQMTAVYEMIEQ